MVEIGSGQSDALMATIGQTLLIFGLVNVVFDLAAAIALRGVGG
jgi:hypothetical protein